MRRLAFERLERRDLLCAEPFLDVDGNRVVDSQDVLIVVNQLNSDLPTTFVPLDALKMINAINSNDTKVCSGEAPLGISLENVPDSVRIGKREIGTLFTFVPAGHYATRLLTISVSDNLGDLGLDTGTGVQSGFNTKPNEYAWFVSFSGNQETKIVAQCFFDGTPGSYTVSWTDVVDGNPINRELHSGEFQVL